MKALVLIPGIVLFLLTRPYAGRLLRTVLLALLVLFAMTGCAALPIPMQPVTDANSNMAEGGFLVLASVDTLQSMHIRAGTSCDHEANPIAAAMYGTRNPGPGRVLFTNLIMMTAHTMVASWLDDKVEAERRKNAADTDNNLGPWYVGRVTFHIVSLVAEGAAVANNKAKGCSL